jgi:ribonuclease HI
LLLRAEGAEGAEGGGGGGARLISDSRLLVETVENWLPARRKAGTAARLKNLDLLVILETLLAALRARAPAAFSHVRAHRPRPAGPFRRAADLRALLEWQGNRRADALATAAVAPPGTPFVGEEVALGGALAEARRWGLVDRWAVTDPSPPEGSAGSAGGG